MLVLPCIVLHAHIARYSLCVAPPLGVTDVESVLAAVVGYKGVCCDVQSGSRYPRRGLHY